MKSCLLITANNVTRQHLGSPSLVFRVLNVRVQPLPLRPLICPALNMCFLFLLLQISINLNLSNAALSNPPPQCSSIPQSSRTVGADAWWESNVVSSLCSQNQVVNEWGDCSVSCSANNRKAVNLTLYWRCQWMSVWSHMVLDHINTVKIFPLNCDVTRTRSCMPLSFFVVSRRAPIGWSPRGEFFRCIWTWITQWGLPVLGRFLLTVSSKFSSRWSLMWLLCFSYYQYSSHLQNIFHF